MSTKDGHLNDGRVVLFEGKFVDDITQIKVFADTLTLIQHYYQQQKESPHIFTYEENGRRYSRTFSTPKSSEDLAEKRKVYQKIAAKSYGMLGRTPDFINAGIAVLPYFAKQLGKDRHTNYAQNITNWANKVKEADLFVSHALQNPQVDRSKTLTRLLEMGQRYAGTWVKEEREDGIIICGAKMVNTLAPFADELLVFNVPNLDENDDAFGVAFACAMNTKGVKTVVRKANSKYAYTLFDYPLSNRFDELDAFILFEDVFIPWERVFVYNSAKKSNEFFPKSGLFVHTAHQDEVRGLVKLEFVTALAKRVATGLGLEHFLRVQEMLGKLTRNVELIRGSVHYSEISGKLEENGVYTPNMQSLLAVRDILPEMYEEALKTLAEFAGGSIVAVPDARDLTSDLQETLTQALSSPLLSAKERALLLNLTWDICGESFGSRQKTYEYLHGGNTMWVKAQHWQNEDLHFAETMLEDCLRIARESFKEL